MVTMRDMEGMEVMVMHMIMPVAIAAADMVMVTHMMGMVKRKRAMAMATMITATRNTATMITATRNTATECAWWCFLLVTGRCLSPPSFIVPQAHSGAFLSSRVP